MTRVFAPDMSRADRRRIEALAPAVDRVVAADAAYFRRFPTRTHRLRLLSHAELEQLVIASAGSVGSADLPTDQEWACAVKQVAPGARLRRFVIIRKGSDLDQPETVCRDIFEALTAGSAEARGFEYCLREALRGQS